MLQFMLEMTQLYMQVMQEKVLSIPLRFHIRKLFVSEEYFSYLRRRVRRTVLLFVIKNTDTVKMEPFLVSN